jgi:hypothetical protein
MVIAIRKKIKQNGHHDRHWDISVIANSYSKLLVTGRLMAKTFFFPERFVPKKKIEFKGISPGLSINIKRPYYRTGVLNQRKRPPRLSTSRKDTT